MSLLPFSELPPFQPRRFLPASVDLGRWTAIEPFFDDLESRAGQRATAASLEAWLLDWSELSGATGEEAVRRYIGMTCHTDREAAQNAYLEYVERVHPRIATREIRLARRFLDHPLRASLPERYRVFNRDTAVTAGLFREANVPLETEESRLAHEHAGVMASMSVEFRGQARTLQEMSIFLEDPDRQTRQEAWLLSAERSHADADRLDQLFDAMVECRRRIAANAGFTNYVDYAWRRLRRFDYTPEQCAEFHAAVEEVVLPPLRELQERRRVRLGLERLRPWDTEVDLFSGPALRPFATIPELLERTQQTFNRVDEGLARDFRELTELGLMDLANRPSKAPGGYQVPLSESRVPFIFLNAVGVQMDVLTLFHECGHAFHTLAARTQPLLAYRTAPREFAEVASLSMELVASQDLSEFYEPADCGRARRAHLERVLESFTWIATVDAFQHWVYSHPGHSHLERNAAWVALCERFGGEVDWSGYESVRAGMWHAVDHIFQAPLYFIEYGIAWLGALQIWSNWRNDPTGALEAFKSALALGGSRTLPGLFEAAGCRFDFSPEALRPVVRVLSDELERLPA